MITLRRATQQDRDAILHVQTQAIEEVCKSHYTKEELQAWSTLLKPNRYKKAIAGNACFVAEKDGCIVGFGHLDQKKGTIEDLYVSPQHVGLGIGKTILQALEREAEASGLKILQLSSTLNAVPFYERGGYRSQNHSKHLLPSGLVICLLMTKELCS